MIKRYCMCAALALGMVCAYAYAQDDEDGAKSVNSYNEEGTGFGTTTAPEKPVKKHPAPAVRSTPTVKSSDEDAGPSAAPAGDDEQYIQSDDYFISEEPFTTQAWIWINPPLPGNPTLSSVWSSSDLTITCATIFTCLRTPRKARAAAPGS